MDYLIFIIVALNASTVTPQVKAQVLPDRYVSKEDCHKAAKVILARLQDVTVGRDAAVIVNCTVSEDIHI